MTTGQARRAVVTGAAGFIGSHLCERLLADGWRVTGVHCFTDYYPRDDKLANLSGLCHDPAFDLLENHTAAAAFTQASLCFCFAGSARKTSQLGSGSPLKATPPTPSQ